MVSRWLATLILVLLAAPSLHAQLLNSWEGSLEDWSPQNGAALANTAGGANDGVGVTEGSDSLEVTVPNQGFQRWGERVLSGQALTDLTTAAENPLTHRIQFDVTYDMGEIPQGSVTFVNQQIAINTSSGWSQIDLGDANDGMTNQTVTYNAPLFRLGTLLPTSTSATLLLATNSDWGEGQTGKIFVDNLRISPIVPDLNEDMAVNVDDWGIFIGNHLADVTGDADERFLLGDLDSDGDNDFTDLRVFEAGYDMANGGGAFARDIGGVPEPAGIWLLILAAATSFATIRRRCRVGSLAAVVALSLTLGGATSAQISTTVLNSWEGSLENWAAAPFGTCMGTTTIGNATIGVTEGSESLSINQIEDGFCWNGQVNYGGGSDQYNAIADAVDVGIANYAIEFDITYDTSSIPTDEITFANTSVALNSSGGWIQYDSLGTWTEFTASETVRVSIPLDQAVNPPTAGTGQLVDRNQTGYYQINIATNGDWGLEPATFYVDNLTLVQLTEPATLTLEVDRADGSTTIKNENGSGSIDMNYYTITSTGNSIDPANWLSLDEQNYDAVDLDMSGVAGDSLLEGWDAAGGSASGGLAEAFLLGSSAVPNGESLGLGQAYNVSVDSRDLQFLYRDMTKPDRLTSGNVVYINEPPSLDCDFNGDDLCDVDDLNLMLAEGPIAGGVAVTPGVNDQFDLNGDNVIDLADRDLWLAGAATENGLGSPYKIGDANLDGAVDVTDFNSWNGGKFTSTLNWNNGDFNGDGSADVSDFNSWNANKFTSSDGVRTVPEPSALCLLWLAAACGIGWHRGW